MAEVTDGREKTGMTEEIVTDVNVTTEPAETQPDTKPAEQPKAPETPKEKLFTQAELERIIDDRLKRERKKYEGFDALKELAAKATAAESKIAEMERERDAAVRKVAAIVELGAQGIPSERYDAALKLMPDGDAKEAVEKLLKEYPWLKETGSKNGSVKIGPTNPAGTNSTDLSWLPIYRQKGGTFGGGGVKTE